MILNGWKEIAQYLGRGTRTVQRWVQLGLPVRRPNPKNHSAVVAFSEELDEWSRIGPESKPGRSGTFKHRVLLVDDDEALLVVTGEILAKQGYEVRTARDGFEALAALRVGLPDILVSDLRMPNMSGFELLAVVRRRFPAVAVVALSGEFAPATMPAILADRYIEKGVNSGFELAEAIRELLSQAPLRGQPAKTDSAPAWIPRSASGYIVLTCPDCLRSFSVATRQIAIEEIASATCIHCGHHVRYRIDETVLPIASELSNLVDRARKSMKLSHAAIEHTKGVIRSSRNNVPKDKIHLAPKKTGAK